MVSLAERRGAGGMEMELEERVVEAAARAAEERGAWVKEATRCAREAGLGLPSVELARALVEGVCAARKDGTPSLWKLLDGALAARLVSPLHTLALLTARVTPHRGAEPEAYRLYLELLLRYGLSSLYVEPGPLRDKITKSVDDALLLSRSYGVREMDFGHAVILFTLSVILSLIDGTLKDWNLQSPCVDDHGSFHVNQEYQMMDVDAIGSSNDKRNEHREQLRRTNALMAIEVVEKITAKKWVIIALRLIRRYMPEKFTSLLQRLQIIEAHKSVLQSLISTNCILLKLSENIKKAMNEEYHLNKRQLLGVLVAVGPCAPTSCHSSGAGKASCWIPFDNFMENSMDGKHLHAISTIEILTELTKTLQVLNQASWQETFQALWISALRLVQRDREPLEGPMPHLDARLCILLSIVPLSIVPILKEDRKILSLTNRHYEYGMEGDNYASRRHGLVSSLQVLGQFSGLLSPPPSVISAANNAATKAAVFVFKLKAETGNLNATSHTNASIKGVGSMLHLIVEACIARKLIDTSAYLWPGYVVVSAPSNDPMSVQASPWSTFMEGAQLTTNLKKALIVMPASSIEELEKLHHLAINGSEEERAAAAKILCGASLIRGWNIQEYAVHIVVKLLSPPAPPDFSETMRGSHLVGYMSMLNSVLSGISCVDTVHILSLYGMVPEVAAALMPVCEAFGSLSPTLHQMPTSSDETSAYSVFSSAFLFLLRLWKFYRPPQEDCLAGRGGTVTSELTLDYLLLMRNNGIAFQNYTSMDPINGIKDLLNVSSGQLMHIDSFPKLQAWYFQNQACIASTLSVLCNKNRVHQVANKILNMICRKMTIGGTVSVNPSSSSSSCVSGSPVNPTEDANHLSTLPAWEVLEAIPFVLEAVLTACAYGRLSSRDLTTGLRDLVDYLPASLATIISYFLAEITRGIWKPVCMNGTDWPSPAANLLSVQSEIKETLASVGIHLPSCYACGSAPVMLPLPMAALVSLSITFKPDKSLDCLGGLVGQALESCATGCSWPSMPVVGALWTQKVRRWHDFMVVACSRSAFTQDKEAITELIRSCFSSFMGSTMASGSHIISCGGVNGLLGYAIAEHGHRLPIAPGFLYLRSCRMFHDSHFVNNVILRLVVEWAHELAAGWAYGGPAHLRSGEVSLATVASKVREVATLGASLLCIAGGLQLVQALYEETLPTFLLSTRERKLQETRPAANILEGYSLAYMLVLSGAFTWGIGQTSPAYNTVFTSRRARILEIHVDFIAGAVEGNFCLGCDPATWKAYVLCFVSLLVGFVPAWVPEVKQEVLQRLATGLRGWLECELALALLERGGPAAMVSVLESVL